jgi:hypothetical protein
MNMCVVYWSEIHQLKYQRGFIFNGFIPNSQMWKYAILTNIFYRIRICSFFIHLAWRRYHSTAKRMIFRMWKNLVHTQSNSDTIARWSSITFFIHPVVWRPPTRNKGSLYNVQIGHNKEMRVYRHDFWSINVL